MAHDPLSWLKNRIVVFEHDSSKDVGDIEMVIREKCCEPSLVLPNMQLEGMVVDLSIFVQTQNKII